MAAIGFGTSTLGREADDQLSHDLLDRAHELGIRHFDTAEAYGGGNARAYRRDQLGIEDERETSGVMHSAELLLGQWIQSRGLASEVDVATKVASGFGRGQVQASLERSLERMRLQSVKVFYLHRPPPADELETALEGLEDCCRAGLTGETGISNFTVEVARPAKALSPSLRYCQNILNLAQREAAAGLIPFCQSESIRFVAYSPLGAGFLTGKYGSRGEVEPKGTRFDVIPGHRDVYFRPEAFAALAQLEELSMRSGVPKHMLAVAWTLRQPGVSIVLIGATKMHHIDNAFEAASLAIDEQLWNLVEPAGAAR